MSAIVPVRNGALNLQRCIDSVLNQSHPAKEMIIIDGGSTDGTVDILRRNSPRLAHWESKPDRGIYDAINKGVRRARGTWITLLGADDYLWDPKVLERLLAYQRRAGDAKRLVHGQVAHVDSAGGIIRRLGGPPSAHTDPAYGPVTIPVPALLIHRGLFDAYGLFDESYRIAADFDFLLRVRPHAEALFVPNVLAAGMTLGGASTNIKNSLRQAREVRRALRTNGATDLPDPYRHFPMMLARYLLFSGLGPSRYAKVAASYRRVRDRLRRRTPRPLSSGLDV